MKEKTKLHHDVIFWLKLLKRNQPTSKLKIHGLQIFAVRLFAFGRNNF